jgi:hypothetical protein
MQYNTSIQESDAALYYAPHPPKAQTPMNAQVTTTVCFFESRLESRYTLLANAQRTEGANSGTVVVAE